MRMVYFEHEDVLHIIAAGGPETQSIELSPDITVEMDGQGQILGVEILNASKHVPKLISQLAGEPQLDEAKIDRIVIAQADDADAWEALIPETTPLKQVVSVMELHN